jgi:hypothetical protein
MQQAMDSAHGVLDGLFTSASKFKDLRQATM